MAVRSKTQKASSGKSAGAAGSKSKGKPSARLASRSDKSAGKKMAKSQAKANGKTVIAKALKGAALAVKTVKALAAKPGAKSESKKAPANGPTVETVMTKAGKTGRGGKAAKGGNPNAAAVERVTERLMGRVSAEPTSDTVCREVACEGLGTSAGYCRLHYIKNWKKIKRKEVILKEGKLNQYIEELVSKYPEKYIEAIRLDLANDKEFAKVIVDLDLDENDDDFDSEGSGEGDVGIDTLKREFEEDADAF
jgi:hypothetical protein